MTAVEQVLADIRAIAIDEHDKGDRFERLMLYAFKTDRTFQQQFSEVWRWMDWPGRSGVDIGVDLVARDAEGRLIAIQCKCYAPTATLTKEEIDSFVALSGQKQWSRRIIVATTDLWSANAEKSLEGHAVPVERIGIDDLEAMTVDWSSYDVKNPTGLKPKARYKLLPHQAKAVDAVRAGFQESDRGKLIMACGTGKTFTALRIAEEHTGPSKSVLFLAPSIALVAQSLKEWTAECDPTAERKLYLCALKDACSGRIVGYSMDARMKASLATAASATPSGSGHRSARWFTRTGEVNSVPRNSCACFATNGSSVPWGAPGRVPDNAAMESFFALLQLNVLNRGRWQTREELRLAIATWIERTYHRRRRQRGLGKLTPTEFEALFEVTHAA